MVCYDNNIFCWFKVLLCLYIVHSQLASMCQHTLDARDLGSTQFWVIDIFAERCTNEMRRNEDFRKLKTTNYNYWLDCLFASSIRTVAQSLFYIIILNTKIWKYVPRYNFNNRTNYKRLQSKCSMLTQTKDTASQTFSEKGSLAAVQVFITKFFLNTSGCFFLSNAKSRCKYFNHFSHTFSIRNVDSVWCQRFWRLFFCLFT